MRFLLFFTFLLTFFVSPSNLSATPLTLEEAYQKTIQQSERLKRSEQDIKIAEAKYKQAIAGIYPKINLNATQRYRNDNQTGSLTGSGGDSETTRQTQGGRSPREFQAFASVQQPLFTGFREFLLSDAAESEIEAKKLDNARIKDLLYLDVADVFYQVYLYEADISLLSKEDKIFQERIDELKKFLELGRSRDSEVIAVESDRASLAATRETQKGALAASKELLAFLTGTTADSIKTKLEAPQPILPLDNYLSRVQERPDLHAHEARTKSELLQLKAAEREGWPSLAFEGNVYPYEDPDLNRDWDVLFRLQLPIFEGGAIEARVAEQRATLEIQRLTEQEAKRSAEKDIRSAYAEAQAAKAALNAIRGQVTATHNNTISQRKDYELGVVTNLDVLTAIRTEQSARRDVIAAEAKLQTALARLSVAAGGVR